jgi:hypothetical protein
MMIIHGSSGLAILLSSKMGRKFHEFISARGPWLQGDFMTFTHGAVPLGGYMQCVKCMDKLTGGAMNADSCS